MRYHRSDKKPENLFCAGTYKKILDTIAKPVLEGAKIQFETKVEKISYRMDPEEKVKVQVNGGQTLEFDEVVFTAPLGWLKRNLDAFEPALPLRMTKAIQSIGYGCLEKVCHSQRLIRYSANQYLGLHFLSQGILARSRGRRSECAGLCPVAIA